MTEPIKLRPSRTYKDGIGKPVVAKRWDAVARAYLCGVVFPPCNNFGCWMVEPESRLVRKAQEWCLTENARGSIKRRNADRERKCTKKFTR